jgi:hypothetical protein
MFKIILSFVLFSSIAFSQDCRSIYEDKGQTRDNLHSVLLIGAAVGVSTAASGGIITLIAPSALALTSTTAAIGTQFAVYGLYATAILSLAAPAIDITNKFEKVEQIIIASEQRNMDDVYFQKLVRSVRKIAKKENCEIINEMNDTDLNSELSQLIFESNLNQELCPLIKKSKRALFTPKSLAVFLKSKMC